MAQYRVGTATFTNGSQIVTGTGTSWLANLSSGDLIIKTGDAFAMIIGSVDSDTQVTLSANYPGTSDTDVAYVGHIDFNAKNIPLMQDGDLETVTIYNDGVNKLSNIIPDKASQAEAEAGVEDTKFTTSLKVKQSIDANTPNKADQATAEAGLDDDDYMTSLKVKQSIDANSSPGVPGQQTWIYVQSETIKSTTTYGTFDTSPQGVWWSPDGRNVGVLRRTGSVIRVYKNLPVPWSLQDLNAAEIKGNVDLSGQVTTETGVVFDQNGLNMYILDSNDQTIYRYTFSTAWDYTTASYTNSASFSANVTLGSCMWMDPTIENLIIGDNTTDDLVHYTIDTPLDITDTTYVATTALDTRVFGTSDIEGIAAAADGSRVIVQTDNGSTSVLSLLNVSTPMDFTTMSASYDGFYSDAGVTDPTGIYIDADGYLAYATDRATDTIHQYVTNTTGILDSTGKSLGTTPP